MAGNHDPRRLGRTISRVGGRKMRELTMQDLYLAWQMGKLNHDDEFLDAIPTMSEDEVKMNIHTLDEFIDWE